MSIIEAESFHSDEIAVAISDDFPLATLLLVMCDPQQRQMCKLDMESQGYHVLSTSLGHEALKALRHTPVDLVIVDAVLPDMHGLDLIGKIAAHDSRLPIILRAPAQDLASNFRYWAADAVVADAPGEGYFQTEEIALLLQNGKSLN